MDKKSLPDGVKCTIYSLCKEIAANSSHETGDTVEDIYKKFTNKDGSGVIDHLRNDLNFEVDEYDEFQKYQFLKLMYIFLL